MATLMPTTQRSTEQDRRRALAAGLSAASVMALTSFHHVYGAVIYRTPWRHHIAPVSLVSMLLIGGALFGFVNDPRSTLGRCFRYTAAILIGIVPVGFIGLFEGVYNHLLKNLLYFGGAPRSLLARLFPTPPYEMPNDLLFESTGILQVALASLTAYQTYLLVRRTGECATRT